MLIATRTRVIAVVVAGTLVAATATGCTGGGPGDESADSITVAMASGDGFWPGKFAEFTQETGIQVELQEIPHDNLHEKLATEAVSASGAIDVIAGDQLWLGDFAAKGFVEPLDIDADTLVDFEQSALDSLSYEGTLYGMPYETQAPVLYYRPSLLEDAGIEVPTTWDELREAARTLTDSSTGVFGYPIEGKQSIDPAIHFLDKLVQAGGAVVDEGKVVLNDGDAAVRALQYLLDIQYTDKSSPPGAPGYETNDLTNLFAQGKAAMVANWQYAYPIIADPAQSSVPDDVALALEPGDKTNATTVWSWGWATMSSSKHKENAQKFIDWATSVDVLTDLQRWKNAPSPRISVASLIADDDSLTDLQKAAYQTFAEAVHNGVVVTSVENWPTIHNELALMVSSVLSQQASPEDAVKTAAEKIQAIVDQQ